MTHGSLSLDKGIMMLISVAVDSCFMLLSVVLCFFLFWGNEKGTPKRPNSKVNHSYSTVPSMYR